MAKYYYLVSSLADLFLDGGRKSEGSRGLFLFCMEEMEPKDFEQIRKLFLFNDIKNTVYLHFNKKQRQDDYMLPAYYDEISFNDGLQDTSTFLPFLSRFYELKKLGKRLYPELPETDELTALFYEDLESFTDEGFLRDYFLFELNLHNITSVLSFRRNGLPLASKLIPIGSAYETICQNESAHDFGLTNEFPFLEQLLSFEQNPSLLEMEKTIEDIRWKWLDENLGDDFFSTEAIVAYFVKLNSVERWDRLDRDKGEELFNGLMNTIKRSIRFSIEFSTTGDR